MKNQTIVVSNYACRSLLGFNISKTGVTQIMRHRRAKIKGGTYFFTVVTYRRQGILTHSPNVHLLREAFRYVMTNHPFTIDAFVLLPDHLHCMWSMPEKDGDYSKRWQLIKGYFSRHCDDRYKQIPTGSRQKKKNRRYGNNDFGSI